MRIKYIIAIVLLFIIGSLAAKAVCESPSSCTVYVNSEWTEEHYDFELIWDCTAFSTIARAIEVRGSDCGSSLVIITEGPVVITANDTIPGDLILNNSESSTITGTIFVQGNLIINNIISLTGDGNIEVQGNMTFGDEGGILTLGGVGLKVDGYFYDFDEDHYIDASGDGSVTITTHSIITVPVGTNTGFYPVIITASSGQVFAIRTDKEPDLPGNAGLTSGWDVSMLPSGNFDGDESVTISFIYPRNSVTEYFDINNAIIMHFNTQTHEWEALNASHTEVWSENSDYYISTVEGMTDFSPFVIGLTGMITALPMWTKVGLIVIISLLGLFLLRKLKIF